MSEADSTPRRRPPTIDLTAKEVETGDPNPTPKSDADPAHRATDNAVPGGRGNGGPFSGGRPNVIGVVIGAVAAGLVAVAFWLAGFVPVHQAVVPQSTATAPTTPAAPGPPTTKTADTDEISSRLDRIQQALQTPRPDAAVESRLTAAEAQGKALADSLAALTRRVDDIAAASQTALAQAKAAAAAADAAKSAAQASVQAGAQRSDVEALASRIAALESAAKSLSTEVAQRTSSSNADDRAMRMTVAAEALRAAVERGAPYQAELAAVTALGAEPKATAPLEPFAAQGVPSAAELGRELAALTPALYRATEAEPNNNSFLSRLESHAQKIVRITPIGPGAAPVVGDDPAAVIARINAAAGRGDIAAALAEIAKLPDEARTLANGWAKKAGARRAALAESQHIAADALAALSKPVSQ
jgi:hypothetical protein